MKGEYYHPSRDFSGHTFSRSVFRVEYDSGLLIDDFSQAKISCARNKSTRIGNNVAIRGSIDDDVAINNIYI